MASSAIRFHSLARTAHALLPPDCRRTIAYPINAGKSEATR